MKKTARLGLRVTEDQKKDWERASVDQGFPSTAAWISATLDQATSQKSGVDKKASS